ncbi:hypothetical protein FBQ82_02040 [Anaerolineae bacterium CFX7]|nr:hypothetical protein [Anaerolineae bacterium CFX7]
MKNFSALIFLLAAAMFLNGCLGVTQEFAPPPAVSTNVPTALPTLAPSPVPTITRNATPTNQSPANDPTLEKLIEDAKQDLMQRANVPADAITVVSAEPVEWRDASLGCPIEGMMYAQVITPGYLIVLEANGQEYEYHASQTHAVFCEK